MIKIIGLTGPTGSGKSTFCNLAAQFGVESVDADKVYHSLLVPPSPCIDELAAEFGEGILNADGSVDRPALAAIVFDSADTERVKLSRLSAITHKFVLAKIREIIKAADRRGVRTILIDAPALYESGFDKECDLIVCLLASKELRRSRIISRDSLSEERADARIGGQHGDDFYSSRASYVAVNDGSLEHLKDELSRILSAENLILPQN